MPTTDELTLALAIEQYGLLRDEVAQWRAERQALHYGTVGGGPNGNGTYPITLYGQIVFEKCQAQIEFEAARLKSVDLLGSNTLTLLAEHNGCKVSVSNANAEISLRVGRVAKDWSCIVLAAGAASIRIAGIDGAIIRNAQGHNSPRARYAIVTLWCETVASSFASRDIILGGDTRFLA